MNQERIGKFISKLRKDKKLTQEELAEKLKVSSKSISRWETGKCMPDISLLIPLSEILEVSVNDLILGEHIKEENMKQKTEQTIKETIKYSNIKIKKEKKKNIWIIVFVLIIISFILGTIDYKRIKYGEDPLFMLRITDGSKKIHHYLGFGYRVERKVDVSHNQPFVNSVYVRFGTWLFTTEINIVKAEPDYLYISGNDQEIRTNRGSYCWTEEHISKCVDMIDPTLMKYKESIIADTEDNVLIKNLYGKVVSVVAHKLNKVLTPDEMIEEHYIESNLTYQNNTITLPKESGVYYIYIYITAEQGTVLHSFKAYIGEYE